jgi:tetratricopeptide (TPR) repeat protein
MARLEKLFPEDLRVQEQIAATLAEEDQHAEALTRLARTLANLGRAAESQEWFDKAIKLAPSRKENDELVYDRELEPRNQRHFGLFRYADEAEVRVRKVVYRGNWPKELPKSQELATTQ